MNTFRVVKSEETKNCGIANKMALYELLRADGSIVMNKCLTRAIGINETIIYSELLSRNNYFETRGQLQDGYFFNTIIDLMIGTCLSEYQQRKAIGTLVKLGLIETKVKGMPAKRYFKIVDDMYLITSYIAQGKENEQFLRNSRTCTEETKHQEVKKLKGNNTNAIIQKEEYKKNENDNGTFPEEKDSVCVKNQDVVNAIKTYTSDLYKQKTRKNHPYLKPEQYENVYQSINSTAYEYSLGYEELIEIMIAYLNNNTLQTDYNINHFATEGIMLNRIYESGLT